MEEEDDLDPLDKSLEDHIVQAILAEQRRHVLRNRVRVTVGLLALAACFVLFIGLRQQTETVPQYALQLAGDEQMLGPDTKQPRLVHLSEDSVFSLSIRPWERLRGAVTAQPFLYRDGELRAWPVTLHAQDSGAFQLHAPAAELGLAAGRWEIVIVIGRGKHMPATDRIRQALSSASPTTIDGWQILHRAIEIQKR